MGKYFNRYRKLTTNDIVTSPPFIKLDEKDTDIMVIYRVNKIRLDKVSQEYYGVPYYSWLILLANPEFGGSEWSIGDGKIVRVPYPLDITLREYDEKLSNRLNYYG